MMHVADTRDCAFEAFITNLGKYNEGFLVGEWVKFPVTNEEMQVVFRRIGIGFIFFFQFAVERVDTEVV